ncbi:hypothetical protein A0H81_02639 [Grifola frondosa]|uniref:Uncharacterized protein n=1 Tax=Grifola frondosa TaxID=5627 RepID=A0A1C7MTT1_GRIFR|nr:hypothetical protein A0H81_02639 [Grifola frondosa]
MQAGSDAILCLRPVEKRGLPLSTLHDVFRKFRLRLNTPLPEGSAAGPALRAATVLCREMGDPFENELERSEKFDDGMTGEFLWLDEDIPGTIREVKWEAGLGGGDIYLQIARRFDIAINNLRDRAKDNAKVAAFLLHGAPMFLMCLLGPIFFVAGGFFDGSVVVVEPLGQPCFMLMDETDQREQEIARLLYAVEQGLDELKSVSRSRPSVDFLPGLPRIYSSYVLFTQPEVGNLTFHRRLSKKSQCLLFYATLSHPPPTSPSSTPIQSSVVVKLVNKRYGEDVHRRLASRGFAPILYGYSRLDGAPTAYVMEYLGSDWMSLFEFERGVGAGIFKDAVSSKDTQAALKNAIRTTLDEILAFMAKEDIVHGDLRPNNIMMQVDEETKPVLSQAVGAAANLKAIDFDWAGKAGQVFYPELRNEDIESWPACVGSSIDAGHDRRLVDSWWPAFLVAR